MKQNKQKGIKAWAIFWDEYNPKIKMYLFSGEGFGYRARIFPTHQSAVEAGVGDNIVQVLITPLPTITKKKR